MPEQSSAAIDISVSNVFKAFAIIAVVTIHTVAANLNFLSQIGARFNPDPFIIIDQISRFSVPLFVALSGFALAKKYADHLDLKEFYLRRTVKLLPWYFFWTAVIYLFIRVSGEADLGYRQLPLWKVFLLGKADYHLYFVPMISLLYLLFPFIRAVVKLRANLVLALTFFWQVGFYLFLTRTSETQPASRLAWGDQQQYIFFGTWLFYFVLGIFLATKKNFSSRKLSPIFLLLLAAGLFWSVTNTLGIFHQGINIIIATRFTKIAVFFYSTGVILFFTSIRDQLSHLPPKILATLNFIGEQSYLVYLLHTLVIRILVGQIQMFNLTPLPVVILAIMLASLLVADLSQLAVKLIQNRLVRLVSSRSQR